MDIQLLKSTHRIRESRLYVLDGKFEETWNTHAISPVNPPLSNEDLAVNTRTERGLGNEEATL